MFSRTTSSAVSHSGPSRLTAQLGGVPATFMTSTTKPFCQLVLSQWPVLLPTPVLPCSFFLFFFVSSDALNSQATLQFVSRLSRLHFSLIFHGFLLINLISFHPSFISSPITRTPFETLANYLQSWDSDDLRSLLHLYKWLLHSGSTSTSAMCSPCLRSLLQSRCIL